MDSQDFAHERLVAALLARQTHLRQVLERTNEGGPRDSYGRAPYLVQGGERMRVEDELGHVTDSLAIAGV